MNLDFAFLLKLFSRRLHVFFLVALPIAVAAAWLAFSLPARYTAEARLLVETPQVPQELAASTMRATSGEVLQVIQQRLLTRANMLELSREFRLHSSAQRMSPDAIVADMRRRVSIRLPNPRGGSAVIAISFEFEDAEVSAQVTNALVTQLLRENVALRTTVAVQTLAFFDEELERLDQEMSEQTARIVRFKEANRESLPDSLAYRRARQTTQQERLVQLEREMASLRDRRERLVTMFERTGRIDGLSGDALTPEQQELNRLRGELARALVVFAPENPRLRTLEAQIRLLEETVAAQIGDAPNGSPGMTALDLQLTDIDAQMEFMQSRKAMIEEELLQLQASIDATPENAMALEALERDFSNIQNQYNQAVARRAQARVGERIEAQSRGQRITVLEQAIAPNEPSKPNRQRIVMAGAGGGLALGAAVVLLLITMNRAVLRPADVTSRLGLVPFGVVPYFRTRREIMRRRLLIGSSLAIILLGIPAGLWWVDQYYLPLDYLMGRIAERTGLDTLLAGLSGAG